MDVIAPATCSGGGVLLPKTCQVGGVVMPASCTPGECTFQHVYPAGIDCGGDADVLQEAVSERQLDFGGDIFDPPANGGHFILTGVNRYTQRLVVEYTDSFGTLFTPLNASYIFSPLSSGCAALAPQSQCSGAPDPTSRMLLSFAPTAFGLYTFRMRTLSRYNYAFLANNNYRSTGAGAVCLQYVPASEYALWSSPSQVFSEVSTGLAIHRWTCTDQSVTEDQVWSAGGAPPVVAQFGAGAYKLPICRIVVPPSITEIRYDLVLTLGKAQLATAFASKGGFGQPLLALTGWAAGLSSELRTIVQSVALTRLAGNYPTVEAVLFLNVPTGGLTVPAPLTMSVTNVRMV